MARNKIALLSPAVNAQQAPPSAADEQRIFEDKFGQMAYQAFMSKYPDIVADVITFKILDSDIEKATAVGSFVVEANGEFVYIPSVLADNQLKPFDIMYVKSRDIFLPLSAEWLEEIQKGTLASMGEGSTLPKTVATDVDIRNLIVPPTTGRYSYASAEEPLGRKLTKLAEAGPGGAQGFDPQLWSDFVDQFQRTQGSSPGQSLDNGVMDVDTLSKMYKHHMKTWEMPMQAQMDAAQTQMPPAMQAPAELGPAPIPMAPMPKMANTKSEAYESMGTLLDRYLGVMGRGAMAGSATGALQGAANEGGLGDVPGSALRGAVGGALGAIPGRAVGRAFSVNNPNLLGLDAGGTIGTLLGGAGGGFLMSKQDPRILSKALAPGEAAMQEYYSTHPDMYLQQNFGSPYGERTASDESPEEGLKDLLKHASDTRRHEIKLPEFLTRAPNTVKTAFAKVLQKNPRLLKKAADIYGSDVLTQALTHTKTAGSVSMHGGGLYIADEKTTPAQYGESFGSDAPEAFNGVLLRGYHFKDTRPKLNLAVQVQAYHDFQDARDPGIYRLYKADGTPETALVLVEPLNLLGSDRVGYPKDDSKVKRVRTRAEREGDDHEPNALSSYDLDNPRNAVETNRPLKRLAVFGNGDYVELSQILGEQVTEVVLKGTRTYDKAMTGAKAAPTQGKGIFVYKRGAHYYGTMPVELSNVSTGTDGVVKGKATELGGWGGKSFVIDPRSPGNKAMRPRGTDLVVIPASWKWLPIGESRNKYDYISDAKALSDLVLNSLGSMGVSEAVARSAGQSMFSVDGAKSTSKKEAMLKLARDYRIHASSAEAMLKIAEFDGICRAHVMSPLQVHAISNRIKIAQGEMPPQTEMGAPPAMQQAQPAMAAPAPAPAPPSAVEQAFGESLTELQNQMQSLQQTLSVLSTVQQRAQQIEAEQSGMAPPMQGGEDPAMAGMSDPSMQGMDPSMQGMDPAAMGGAEQAPSYPMMRTEEPSSEEIASQVSPEFLEQAAGLQDAGAFDAGAIGSLSKAPSLKSLGSEYAANMENSVDDLGRTLLTLYMQEGELKEQLGDASFIKLETQLRDTFRGLGDLVLSLSHNTAML